MFAFQCQGEVAGLVAGKEGVTYLRLVPVNPFQFKRQGETPSLLQVEIPANVDCKGLFMGQLIDVSGQGAVGSHPWEKREFGKVKVKDIDNYYFKAEKITLVKPVK